MLINTLSPHGGDIYTNKVKADFSANINPMGMPEKVRDAIISSAYSCSAYPDPYCTELRRKLSDYERVDGKYILCGNGAAELIYQFAYSLSSDKPALIVSPTFCEYEQALTAAGIESEYYVLREQDGFRVTENILKTDFSKYCAVFICSPNNPTGITVDREIIYSLAKTGVRLFCDFCFLDLTENPGKYDIPGLIEKYPNVVILRAFTKSYAMAGVRLGYCMCGDTDLLSLMTQKAQCWNVSTLAQNAGTAALDCTGWLKDSIAYIINERKYLTSELEKLGIKVSEGEANYLLLYCEPDIKTELMKYGIMVRSCSEYIGLKQGYVRIAVRPHNENEMLVRALKEILK